MITIVSRDTRRSPDALDSSAEMAARVDRVISALVARGYIGSVVEAIDLRAALDNDTPYCVVHLLAELIESRGAR